jgi:hypothetical protein
VADIFQEVEEDVRQERYEHLWKKYGPYLLGVVALIVAITAGIIGWREYQASENAAAGDRFAQALQLVDGGKDLEAATEFAHLAGNTTAGYQVLALFQLGSAHAAAGNPAEAARAFEQVMNDDGALPVFRDLGRLMFVQIKLEDGGAGDLEATLAPLLEPGSSFDYSALETRAASALKAGDKDRAREALKSISDDADAPQAMRARATELLAAIGGE